MPQNVLHQKKISSAAWNKKALRSETVKKNCLVWFFFLVPVFIVVEQHKVRRIALGQSGSNFIFPFTVKSQLFWEEQNVLFLIKLIFKELRTLRM